MSEKLKTYLCKTCGNKYVSYYGLCPRCALSRISSKKRLQGKRKITKEKTTKQPNIIKQSREVQQKFYQQYWIGKAPTTKLAVEEYINDQNRKNKRSTQTKIVLKYEKSEETIRKHFRNLKKMGFLVKVEWIDDHGLEYSWEKIWELPCEVVIRKYPVNSDNQYLFSQINKSTKKPFSFIK